MRVRKERLFVDIAVVRSVLLDKNFGGMYWHDVLVSLKVSTIEPRIHAQVFSSTLSSTLKPLYCRIKVGQVYC
jgi:hypothetical protein